MTNDFQNDILILDNRKVVSVMIELGNIIYENEKVVRFYLCSSCTYKNEFGLSNLKPEHPKSLYIKIVSDEGRHTSWREMPRKLLKKRQIKNDYQFYFETLVNEYGYSLNEYPQSYVDKILEQDEFIDLTKLFLERS